MVIQHITALQLVNAHDQSYVNVSQDDLLLETVARENESRENLEFLKREEVVQRLSEKMQSWYEICAEGKKPVLKCVALCCVCELDASYGVLSQKGTTETYLRGA